MMKIVAVIISIALFLFYPGIINAQLQTNSNTVQTRVGNPQSANNNSGSNSDQVQWPATGSLTQGPEGQYDHLRLLGYGWSAVDIGAPQGTPVYSAFDGRVTAVHNCYTDGDCSSGYKGFGNSIEIASQIQGTSFTSLYGHLSEIDISSNQTVKKGDKIGLVGNTGHSDGAHLHWQLTGAKLESPFVPQPIDPLNCDTPSVSCNPSYVNSSGI